MRNDKTILKDEEWDELATELDNLFTLFAKHEDFRDSVPRLFALADSVSNNNRHMPKEATEVQREAEELVAAFAGTEALDALIRSVRHLSYDLRQDEYALHWWAKFRKHMISATSDYQGKEDLDKFRVLFRKGYKIYMYHRKNVDRIVDRLSTVISNITNDKYVNRLQDSLSALSDDLVWKDKDGKRYMDRDATSQLASTISAVLKDQFKYFVLPKVEKSDKKQGSFSLDNIVLKATLPDLIKFHLETFAQINTADPLGKKLDSELYMSASMKGITMVAPEIHFEYHGKISDSGIMSVTLPPPGANLTIDFIMRPTYNTKAPLRGGNGKEMLAGFGSNLSYEFVKTKSHFAISDLQIDYDKSTLSHSILTPMGTKHYKAQIIDRIETGVTQALDKQLNSLGEKVISMLNHLPNPLSISSLGGEKSTSEPII